MRFKFRPLKAAQTSACLLKLHNGPLNGQRLMTLLYLADRESLLKNGKPITGAQLISTPNGPGLLEILNWLNGADVPAREVWTKYISSTQNNETSLLIPEPETDELSRFELRILNDVYQKFGPMSQSELFDWQKRNLLEWTNSSDSNLSIEFVDVFRVNNFSEEDIQEIEKEAEMIWQFDILFSSRG